MLLPPPFTVPAERLFRILCQTPRPSLPIDLSRLTSAPLQVVALRPDEEAEAFDAADAAGESQKDARLLELCVRSLQSGRSRVFRSADVLQTSVDETDLAHIVERWWGGFCVVSPSRRYCDWDAWREYLRSGAEHPAAYSFAERLALSVDESVKRGIPRPDRFYGMPLNRLTDGQWLAFRAARAALVENRE
jgi:hypothetical protein